VSVPGGGRLALLTTAAALALSGCVTPATGSDSYHDKAVTSVRAAQSEVATAALTVRLMRHGRILQPYADETVTASETATGAIAATFASVQPPAGDDRLRDDVGSLLSDAQDAVGHARIAVRRADPGALRRVAAELASVTKDLTRADRSLG